MIKLISKCALLSVFALSLSAFSMDDAEKERMDRESRIEEGVKEIMDAADTDGDGLITKEEFAAYMKRENPDIPADEIDKHLDLFFAQMDADKDGVITKVEVALMAVRAMEDSCVNCD
jgi:Ca2+-binding EF-hand superfamily protein